MYLTSKKQSTDSSSNDDVIEEVVTRNVAVSQKLQEDKGKLWRQTYAREDRLRQEMEDVKRLEELRKIRESRVPPEPADTNSQRLRVSVKHSLEGDVSRFFDPREKMLAVYDWVGSLNLFPEHFNLCLTPGKRVEPTECVAVLNGSPLHMEITAEPIPMSPSETDIAFRGFGLGEYDIGLTIPFVEDLDLLNNPFSFEPPNAITAGNGR